jgi:S1-C subfamily serine protease
MNRPETCHWYLRLFGCLAVFVLPFISFNAAAQEDAAAADRAKNRVVMIDARFGEHKTFGAGIILGKRENSIYLTTAKHVVRRGATSATHIRVQFRFLPGESFSGRVLHADEALDLAVVAVSGFKEQYRAIDALAYDALGETKLLRPNDPLHAIGFPAETGWFVSAIPERYLERTGSQLFFQSDTLAEGYSGGPLFNSSWEVIGMIQADHPPQGRAITIERVLETIGLWGYPTDFRSAAGISGKWVVENGDQDISFVFKVIGQELFGTVVESDSRKGILDGRIEGDRIAFYTTRLLKHKTAGGMIQNPGAKWPQMVPDQYSFERIRTFYRGTVKSDLIDFIRQSEAGDPPEDFSAIRPEDLKKIKMTRGWMGIGIETITNAQAVAFGLQNWSTDAVIVNQVLPDGPAATVLQVDDIILAYDGAPITAHETLIKKVRATPPGTTVNLRVFRRGKTRDLSITVEHVPEEK